MSARTPCPRWATREEWSAWLQTLSWEEQLSRGDNDHSHEYTDSEIAVHDLRRDRREALARFPDPFHYCDERRGPWPAIDSVGVPAYSNTWRADLTGGWTPGGFPRHRPRRISHRELWEDRIPKRCKKARSRADWCAEAIESQVRSLQRALRLVLAERHQRLGPNESNATTLAMAWNYVAATRAALGALRELYKQELRSVERDEPQMDLF